MACSKYLFLMVLGLMGGLAGSSAAELLRGLKEGNDSLPCLKKLIPCQPYLHVPEKAPVSCCLPLKQMVSDDTKCLCGVFNDADMLNKLNLTQDDALKLPKACGASADISICNKDGTSPPKSPSASNNSSSTKNAAHSPSHFGGSGFGFAAIFMALIISAAAPAPAPF